MIEPHNFSWKFPAFKSRLRWSCAVNNFPPFSCAGRLPSLIGWRACRLAVETTRKQFCKTQEESYQSSWLIESISILISITDKNGEPGRSNQCGWISTVFVGGQPRVQFLPGSFAGSRRAFNERLEAWDIRNIDGFENCEGNSDELMNLAKLWISYKRRNLEFFTALNNMVEN